MSYNLLAPVTSLTSGDMSGSIVTTPVEIKLQDNVGVQLHWTGAPVGVFSVQISMNYRPSGAFNTGGNAGDWINLTLNPAISAAGTPDDAYIDLNQLSAPYVRVVYTPTSGTGALTVYINGKGV